MHWDRHDLGGAVDSLSNGGHCFQCSLTISPCPGKTRLGYLWSWTIVKHLGLTWIHSTESTMHIFSFNKFYPLNHQDIFIVKKVTTVWKIHYVFVNAEFCAGFLSIKNAYMEITHHFMANIALLQERFEDCYLETLHFHGVDFEVVECKACIQQCSILAEWYSVPIMELKIICSVPIWHMKHQVSPMLWIKV